MIELVIGLSATAGFVGGLLLGTTRKATAIAELEAFSDGLSADLTAREADIARLQDEIATLKASAAPPSDGTVYMTSYDDAYGIHIRNISL